MLLYSVNFLYIQEDYGNRKSDTNTLLIPKEILFVTVTKKVLIAYQRDL